MKKLLLLSLTLVSMNSFAFFTEAQIVGASFNNDDVLDALGESRIKSVKVIKNESDYSVKINEKNLLVDGCSVEVSLAAEKYAVSPLATGIRLRVTEVDKKCGFR